MLPLNVRNALRRALRRRNAVESEIDEEIAFHLQERIDALVDRGCSVEDAVAEAERRFGDPATVRHDLLIAAHRRERRLEMLEWIDAARANFKIAAHQISLSRDLKHAVRSLTRRPAFAVAVISTLGLGIGANTAVFSLVDAVILHPLPVAKPDELVAIFTAAGTNLYGSDSYATYRDIAARNTTLSTVAASWQTPLAVGNDADAEDLTAAFVTDNYFATLGVIATQGRTIAPSDFRVPNTNAVVVLSDAVWQSRFGADRTIVGRQVRLGGRVLTVIGVGPKSFRGTNLVYPADVWIPLSLSSSFDLGMWSKMGVFDSNDGPKLLSIIGRLAAHTSVEQASANLNALARSSASSTSTLAVTSIAQSAAAVPDRNTLFRFVRLLFGVVVLTLLLACVNVANLLVIRANERASELGVRIAMGVSRFQLARQLFVESLVLAITGGALGVAIAVITVRLFSSLTLPGGLALEHIELGLDARVLVFTAALSCLTAIGFGLGPALQATRTNVVDVLKGRSTGRPRLVMRSALLAMQVAMSLILLVGAGLFLRSLQRGLSTDLGFDPRPLATVRIIPQLNAHRERAPEYAAVVERAKHMPGILGAAAASHVPISGLRALPFNEGPAGNTHASNRKTLTFAMAAVTDDYFDVLGVPLIAGRRFGVQDGAGATRVTIVNESAARALWPNESALGKQINFMDDETYTVVGVVRDTKYSTLQDRGVPFGYAPMAQEDPRGNVIFLARSKQPQAAISMLRSTIAAVSPKFKVTRAQTVADQIKAVLMPQQFGAMLLSAFALVALGIAGVGIYGTVAYAVAQRRTEIGIRAALGAQRRDVLALVLIESGAAVVGGIVCGVIGAALTTGFVAHFLYGVTGSDWVSFSGAIGAVVLVSVSAVLIPASRAVRVDPAQAIRTPH